MDEEKILFLLTRNEKSPYQMKNLKKRYRNKIIFVDDMMDADLILCIGENLDNKEKNNLIQARELGIPISYFTEDYLPIEIIDFELQKERKCSLDEGISFRQEEIGY